MLDTVFFALIGLFVTMAFTVLIKLREFTDDLKFEANSIHLWGSEDIPASYLQELHDKPRPAKLISIYYVQSEKMSNIFGQGIILTISLVMISIVACLINTTFLKEHPDQTEIYIVIQLIIIVFAAIWMLKCIRDLFKVRAIKNELPCQPRVIPRYIVDCEQ